MNKIHKSPNIEEIRHRITEKVKLFYKNMSKEEYENYCKTRKEICNTVQHKERQSTGRKQLWIDMSEERYIEICLKQKEAHNNTKFKEKINKSQRIYWDNMTEKDYKEYCKNRKESHNKPEFIENMSKIKIEYCKNNPEIWICNNINNTKYVTKENAIQYINDGWQYGRKFKS